MIKTNIFAYSSLEVNYFESRGASLAIRIVGQGPPLILLHGWPLHGYSWKYVLPKLSKHFKCYVVDMPGLGNSKWTQKTDFHWIVQANRIIDLIKHYNLKGFSFLAHNTGASIARIAALELDADLKKEFKNLIAINTEIPYHRPPYIPFYQMTAKLPLSDYVLGLLMKNQLYIKSKFGFGGFYQNKKLLDSENYFTKPYISPLLTDRKRLKGVLKYLVGCDLKISDTFATRHKEITANVLLIWGENCPIFPVSLAEKMSEQFTSATFQKISNCCFLPHEENPELVLSIIIKFLEKST